MVLLEFSMYCLWPLVVPDTRGLLKFWPESATGTFRGEVDDCCAHSIPRFGLPIYVPST